MSTIWVYVIGAVILAAIMFSFVRDIANAATEKERKRLIVVLNAVVFGGALLFMVISSTGLSERLFPDWYERDGVRQEINAWEREPFKSNGVDLRDYAPFKEAGR